MCHADENEASISKIHQEFACAKAILEFKGSGGGRVTAWRRQQWRMIWIDGRLCCDCWGSRCVRKTQSLDWTSDRSAQDERTGDMASFILIA